MARSVTLRTGAEMPMVGLGTWKSQPGQVKAAVEKAIDAGYRHIDGAFLYGNEKEIGEAIQCAIAAGKVKREDLFITTKLWNTHYRRVREGFDLSFKALNLDYVDLYLMHWPHAMQYSVDYFPVDENGAPSIDEGIHYTEVWKEMEKIHKEGLAKAIGVCNFNLYQMERLLKDATIPPAVHQYEIHPYLDQKELLEFCQSHSIVVTGQSPLGSIDRPWAQPDDPNLLHDATLQKLAEKYRKSVAQILIRFQIQLGIVVIPKSVTPSRIASNFQVFDFEISKDDMDTIRGLGRNWRAMALPHMAVHKYFPFKENYSE